MSTEIRRAKAALGMWMLEQEEKADKVASEADYTNGRPLQVADGMRAETREALRYIRTFLSWWEGQEPDGV